MYPCDGKTTMIRRTAVRVTGVSRHYGGPIEGFPELLPPPTYHSIEHHSTPARIEGLKGPPSCRDTRTVDTSFPSLMEVHE